MANYSTLKATIDANVDTNGTQAITGSILNSVLNAMVTSLGAGYQYMGVATTSTNPGTPDQNVFYVASEPGTYTNFGSLSVSDGEVAILKYNGSWVKEVTGAATAAELGQLGLEAVKSKTVLSINLFNKDSTNLYNGYCGTNGYNSNSSYRMTHPIYVTGGVSYTCPGQGNLGATQRVAYCTKEGTFISSFQVSLVDGYVTFTPASSGYIRVNIGATNKVDAFMFCKTSEYPDNYTPYYESLVVGDAYGLGTKEKTEVAEVVYNEVKDSLPWNKLVANEGIPATNGLYYTGGTHKVIYLGGQRSKLTIKANSTKNTYFLVLKTYTKPTQFGSDTMVPDYATGESGRHVVTNGTELVYHLPSDARYIVIEYTYGTDDMSPVIIEADGIDFYNDARIALGPVADTQRKALKENLLPLYCPAPQAPANDTAGSDFNAENLTAAQLQAAFDSLVEVLPRYSSLYGVIGKDCTGNNDLKAYVFTRRNRFAFKAADALFAWKDQSDNVVYIDSVSPLVGSSIYSDTSRTVAGTIASYAYVSGTATMTDGNGTTYTRDEDSNVAADVVFSKTLSGIETGFTAYDSSDSSAGSATSSDGIHYTLSGKTYTRFAGFDYHTDVHFTLLLVGNVHGPQSDPLEPSITMYRLAKDLCTGAAIKNHRFINYLKQNARIVLLPVANPSGILKWVNNQQNGRENANNVNINRNFDTPGWASLVSDVKGTYPGDQAETQYIMNLFAAFNPDAAYDCHCYAYWNAAGSSTCNASAFGLTPNAGTTDELIELFWSSFGIKTWKMGADSPATSSTCDAYIQKIGAKGSTIEMWAGEATASASAYYNGHQHTPLVMEYCYSMLLNSIKNVWMLADTSKDFSVMGIQ